MFTAEGSYGTTIHTRQRIDFRKRASKEIGTGLSRIDLSGDADGNGKLDLTDAIFTLEHQAIGGPATPEPGPGDCEPDPTGEDPHTTCDSTKC